MQEFIINSRLLIDKENAINCIHSWDISADANFLVVIMNYQACHSEKPKPVSFSTANVVLLNLSVLKLRSVAPMCI